jgi:hypothetical protein
MTPEQVKAIATHSFPVRLFSAARAETVHFHILHKKDLSRVKEVWFCTEEDKPIERSDIRPLFTRPPWASGIATATAVPPSRTRAALAGEKRQWHVGHISTIQTGVSTPIKFAARRDWSRMPLIQTRADLCR